MLGLETAHSPNAKDIDTVYTVMLVLAGVFVLAVNAALIGVVVRFRAARGKEPARTRGPIRTQVRAGAVFAAVAIAVFVLGVVYTDKARDIPADSANIQPLKITAVGQQWIWRYEYPSPNGSSTAASTSPSVFTQTFSNPFSYYKLVVPVDTTIDLTVDSTDVVHRWWVPALGPKIDAVPGHVGHTWFRADRTGVYYGQSAGFSGASYAVMRTQVQVVTQAEYQAWLAKQIADVQAAQTYVQQVVASAPGSGGVAGKVNP